MPTRRTRPPAPQTRRAHRTPPTQRRHRTRRPPRGGVVPSHLERFLEHAAPDEGILGRDDLVRDLLILLSQRKTKVPLIVGRPGSGRTAVLAALARFLADGEFEGALKGNAVVRVRPEAVVASVRANALRQIKESNLENVIVALDDLEVLCAFDGDRADPDMLGVVGALVSDPEVHIVLTTTVTGLSKLKVQSPALHGAVEIIELDPLPVEVLEKIAFDHGDKLARFHSVDLSDVVLRAAIAPRGKSDQRDHPGLLVDRLDRACARAGLTPKRVVGIDDLQLPSGDVGDTRIDREKLQGDIARILVGQDHALGRVCDRLALTKARLDLNPQRPDGVFLFVGPTGVGKTLMAQVLQKQLFNDDSELIVLDMSEYSEQWALSRLIGPQPGYVGFTEPDSWLTTRVIKSPQCVLLLDEIEKAHPSIWNAFLQVFDAGRLTDSRGQEALFEEVVIVMTSNLGSDIFSHEAIGFGEQAVSTESQSHTVLETVKRTMPPELINRLDEILVFQPLSRASILDIAERKITEMTERIVAQGYVVIVTPEAVELVAEAGYEPAYGARHLERNIEKLLLEPLASGHSHGEWKAVVDGDRIVWQATSSV